MSILIEFFPDFRAQIYDSFPYRADATMNLIDAMSSNTSATSPVQLTLNPVFPRQYSSLHDAVDNFFVADNPDNAESERHEQRLARMQIVGSLCPKPVKRNFYLSGIDTVTQPRPFAETLQDRGIHYHPNPAPGNKPITVGHSYSVLAALPEKEGEKAPPWILPLLIQRVPTDKKAADIGYTQISDVINDDTLPFGNHLTVLTGDSGYSSCEFLNNTAEHDNLVSLVRVRGNRVFYQMPSNSFSIKRKGHPKWYGSPFKLNNPLTRPEPEASETVPFTLRNGRECQVTIDAWYDMLMRGKRDIPMHNHPFTLLCVTVRDKNGKKVFARPLWLIVVGQRRGEITLADAYDAYRQRFDLEHFFRFGKNRLLMASYQTPEIEHEENWWEIAGLAYVNLYTAAFLANRIPYPWERWLPDFKEPDSAALPSPSMVQRDLPRIIEEFGTPAKLPKPRGKSPGRQSGYSPGKRDSLPVVKKGKKSAENYARSS